MLRTVVFLILPIFAGLGLAPRPAAAQGQWMDIGSGATYVIAAENDSRSFERFPSFAFGSWESGIYYIYAELIPIPCGNLPSPDICDNGRFVAAFDAYLDPADDCPCSGLLMRPVELELGYNPARVASLGGREEDVRLALYDYGRAEWLELQDQRAVPERDVIAGSHLGHGRQVYALLLAPPIGGPTSWGRIKAHWSFR